MRVLALECSTSQAKAAIYDSAAGTMTIAEKPWPADAGDVATLDADKAYDTLIECAAEALRRDGGAVSAVALCAIWHSLLPLDAEMRPLSRAWTWANTQAAASTAERLADTSLGKRIYRITGCPPNSSFPLWQYLHRSNQGDSAVLQARYIASLHSYLYFRLTGTFAASVCSESGSSFMDLATGRWSLELLRLAGLNDGMFPPIMEMDDSLPLSREAAAAMGLPQGLPVAVGGPDGALNQIGSGATERGIMTLSVGTSGAIRLAVPQPVFDGNASTWCYYLYHGSYIMGAATSGAGNCVNWFRSFFPSLSFSALEEMAVRAEGSVPIYLPFNFGERAPGYRGDRKGGFVELEGAHTPGHLYRALLEGILFNLYQCFELVSSNGGTPKEIRVSGGITRSRLWLQIAADLFGHSLLLSDIEHASVAGAAALALKAAGGIVDIARFPAEITGSVQPRGDHREELLRRYQSYLKHYSNP